MERTITVTHPHDLYRRFKEDEYLPLDGKVAKMDETLEKRFMLSRKGLFEEKEEEGNVVEKQLLQHNLELEKLHRKGNLIMTNIKTACEQRQSLERKKEKTFEEGILENMKQKYVEIEEKIGKIHDRWEKLKSRQNDEPQKYLKTLKILRNQILELTKSKDDIIQSIKNDMTRINASYQSVLVKQDYDLHYLMQRANNYLNDLKQCYVRQILKLDDTINQFHQDEYERLYKCRHEFSTEIIVGIDTSKMLDNIDKKYEVEREYRESLRVKFRELRTEYDEVTHAFRMHMEKDQENMELELEEKTSTYFLNSLKFNYNYQVLEKKNTENVNQMVYEEKKKNWMKLMNSAADLRKQIKETKSVFESKSFDIADQSGKIRDRLSKLEVKAKNATADNESKFQNILKMNLEEMNHLLSQICVLNKMFFEEHLGIRWEPPDLQILVDSNLEALQSSKKSQQKVLSTNNKSKQNNGTETENWKILEQVFEVINSSMGYLMDKDLPEILELCEKTEEEKKLVQLDNVFSALGFNDSNSLTKFLKNLELFAYCEDEKVIQIHNQGDQAISSESTSPSTELTETFFFVPNADKGDDVSIDLELMRCIEDLNQNSSKTPNFHQTKAEPIHKMNVKYAHILSALEMTAQSMEAEKSSDIKDEKTVPHLHIDVGQRKDQIQLLWNNYRTMFPNEHVQMWSSLECGLSDYLVHLKKRQKLHTECDMLRRQNAQLKYMLQELL